MEYKLKVYDIYEVGKRVDKAGNPHQEDSMYPPFGKATEADRLFIVCDGMGGHEAGEVASATVCEEMSKSVNASLQKGEAFSRSTFDAAYDAAFKGLDAKDLNPESMKKMGTTMTFLELSPAGAFIAHVGDSRVYHIRPGKDASDTSIEKKTYDHSLVNDLVRIGEIQPEDAKTHPRRNVITRAMQPHLERRPKADVYETADVRPGDYFYMCTDGMLEVMEDEEIKQIFSAAGGSDEEKVNTLIEKTKDNQDNHTAYIVHVIDVIGNEDKTDSAKPEASEADGKEATPNEKAGKNTLPNEKADISKQCAASAPLAKTNSPLTATKADKRQAKAARMKWMFLALVALIAVAFVLLILFASK